MSNATLVLQRRIKQIGQDALHCRELELRLTEDGRHVLLSRYLELYCHEKAGECSVRHYRVPLASMIRWMVDNAEQRST
ncbi:hypothetical protein THH46_19950 [Pseudomonas sp. NA13]|uniref:Uncharacterized protein n=1 Tax=Pseudomonas brassicacearum TaxID=930166 RepID=A0AAJ3FTI6_9PSED|nr:hypothetical protein [Pseudomonas brassicacearum]NUT80140.1 hypothetical protein [Pseudomonas brassicacearum]QGA50796.1 hypothetical protein GFU70_17235 [Pseudomonas brassicacearum]